MYKKIISVMLVFAYTINLVVVSANMNRADNITIVKINGISFTIDFENCEWAKEAIYYVLYNSTKNLLTEQSDYIYRINEEKLTRADFIRELLKIYPDVIDYSDLSTVFSDVYMSEYFYNSVNAAKSAGIIEGDENNNFYPFECITKQDAAVMVYRYLSLFDIEYNDLSENVYFDDNDIISEYARESIYRLKALGIIHGDNTNCFEPLEFITLAESAVIIFNTAKYLDHQGKFTLAQFKFDDSL